MTELPKLTLHSWHYVHSCPSYLSYLSLHDCVSYLSLYVPQCLSNFPCALFTSAFLLFLVFLCIIVLFVFGYMFLLVFPMLLVLLFTLS